MLLLFERVLGLGELILSVEVLIAFLGALALASALLGELLLLPCVLVLVLLGGSRSIQPRPNELCILCDC